MKIRSVVDVADMEKVAAELDRLSVVANKWADECLSSEFPNHNIVVQERVRAGAYHVASQFIRSTIQNERWDV